MAVRWDGASYHILSDTALKKRSLNDPYAQSVLSDIAMIKSFVCNPHRATIDMFKLGISDELNLRFHRTASIYGRVEILIDCENTNEIVRCKKAIDAWRIRLANWQGTTRSVLGENKGGWEHDIFARTLLKMDAGGTAGHLHAEIAHRLNKDIIEELKQYVRDLAIYEEAKRTKSPAQLEEWTSIALERTFWPLDKWKELTDDPIYQCCLGETKALNLLQTFQTRNAQQDGLSAEGYCKGIIAQLKAGEAVEALRNSPITRFQVRDRMRTWETKNRGFLERARQNAAVG